MRANRWWRSAPPELLVLTALSFLTRCWRLYTPSERVWDEVHFEEFASRYFSGSYYIDVHPPLGKLLYALTAWLTGVSGTELAQNVSAPQMRLLPAVLGSLLIPTFWWFLRELGASRKVAAFGAALLLLDNAVLVQSRFVLLDTLLVWFGLAAVAAFLAARRSTGLARWGWLIGAALLAGATASIKWTGLTALGLIGLTWLIDAWRRRPAAPRRVAGELAVLVVLPAAVYLGSFAAHFALLPNDGIGVHWMPPEFAATRRGNPAYRADVHLSFVGEVAALHRVMLTSTRGMSAIEQPAASPWFTWPTAKHRIRFWQGIGDSAAEPRSIELLGNPVLWFGIIAAIALFAVALTLRRVAVGGHRDALVLLGAGYVMNFVPFAFITRPMYLYHYTFALVYSAALASFVVGLMTGWQNEDAAPWRFASSRARALYVGTLLVVLASFVYFAPLTYGTALSERAAAQRAWMLESH